MGDQAQIGALEAAVGQVQSLRSTVTGYGEPSRLAGDPAALRGLAGAHGDAASELDSAVLAGGGQAARLAGGGAWEGSASGAFGGFWSTVAGSVGELATRHAQLATSLNDLAGRATTLNGEVTDLMTGIDTWLGLAIAAAVTMDTAAAPGLVAAAGRLLTRWDDLLPELESFASSMLGRLDVDLGISLPTPWPGAAGGEAPPGVGPFPGLPGLPNILINVPAPQGPSILINVPGRRRPARALKGRGRPDLRVGLAARRGGDLRQTWPVAG